MKKLLSLLLITASLFAANTLDTNKTKVQKKETIVIYNGYFDTATLLPPKDRCILVCERKFNNKILNRVEFKECKKNCQKEF